MVMILDSQLPYGLPILYFGCFRENVEQQDDVKLMPYTLVIWVMICFTSVKDAFKAQGQFMSGTLKSQGPIGSSRRP